MSNYDEEEKLMEQENKGQGIDPIGVAQDAMEINNRIQQSRMKNDGNVDVAPKATKAASDAASTTSAGGANAAGGTAAKTAANAAATSGASATGAATAGTAGTTAAATATVGTTTAASSTGLAALMANPYFWAVVGGIILLILIIAFVLIFSSAGSAFSEGTASDENIMAGVCEEGDTECEDFVKVMNDNPDFGKYDMYEQLLQYCGSKESFFKKFTDFLTSLVTDDAVIETSCDLAQAIEKYAVAKEKELASKQPEANIKISRGLMVGTLQYLYEGIGKMEDKSNTEIEDPIVDASSANNVLANVAAWGMITTKDIKALIEYMVYNIDYTSYTWGEVSRDEHYMCKYDEDNIPYDCKTLIRYGCIDENYKLSYSDINKYFLFLRFGGSYREIYDGKLERNRYLWNNVKVVDGKLTIEKHGYDELLDTLINDPEPPVDPATSYQEITSYNESYSLTSDECKIPGKAEESLPESTEDTIYEFDPVKTVEKALIAMFYEPIDTMAYEVDQKNITGPKTAVVLGSDCKLNNVKSETERCDLLEKELNYVEGFMYANYPQYKYTNDEKEISADSITGETYTALGESIEGNIALLDEYEDYLNDLFGFNQYQYGDGEYIPGMFGGSGSSASCLAQENLKIRLQTCSNANADEAKKYRANLPGGYSYINGSYVANNTISFDEYIKGVTVTEFGASNMTTDKIEALKFQIIIQKSYFLNLLSKGSSRFKEVNGEVYASVGSSCAQNFGNVGGLTASRKSVLETAYSAVKNILLYEGAGTTLNGGEYGSDFTNRLITHSKSGLKYEEILNQSNIRSYTKNGSSYANAEFRGCSTTTELGNNFVQNAAAFLKGGSGPTGGWMNKDFINSQYKSTGDFQYGHAWCAKFVNLIKKLTPNVDAKIGSVSSFGAVSNWMRHFASNNNLAFCASVQYSHVGCYKGTKRYIESEPYKPKAGDLIFYAYTSLNGVKQAPWNGNPLNTSNQDHIAIIASVYDQGGKTCIDTIEGNVGGQKSDGNSVRYYKCSYYTTHPSIVGYGIWE